MKKIIFIIAVLILSIITLKAQDSTSNKILLTGKSTGDKIILRWAPGDAGTWHISNYYGYMIEKLSFKDSTEFFNNNFKLLTPDTLKPWPLNDWEPIANKSSGDKYAALAAQAIWGERNKSNPDNNANFWEQANELENLYAVALLSADFSSNAAKASALRYEDNDINSSMTYLYRVYSLASNDENPIDTAYLMLKGENIGKSIEVKIEEVVEKEKAISIHWSRELENNYTAWFIERSVDNKNFYKLNESPYIDSPLEESERDLELISFTDTLQQNYVKYYYRIIGINTYAEYSSPSESVEAMGRDRTPPPPPQKINAKQIAPSQMQITWTMPEICDDLKGFLISRSNHINKNEVGITNDILPKETRSYIDTSYNELMNNWYYVYAVDTAGNAIVGLPEHGSIIDSLPPSPPKGLTGSIDSNGIVNVNWDLGKEKDIFGYTVFTSNQEDHVFITVNNKPIRNTKFKDTINLKTLTENIYYRIAAIDLASNISEFSEILTLKKPDIIPPVPPVFNDYKITKEGIKLSWVPSSSHDVESTNLYRKLEKSEEWELIKTINDYQNNTKYIDENLIPDQSYQYKVTAIDDDGLESDVSFILTLIAIDFTELKPVKIIEASINDLNTKVTLSWNYENNGELKYQIFRAVDGGGFNLLREVFDPQNQIIDDVQKGKKYEYTVQVIKNDKKKSEFSNTMIIDLTTNN